MTIEFDEDNNDDEDNKQTNKRTMTMIIMTRMVIQFHEDNNDDEDNKNTMSKTDGCPAPLIFPSSCPFANKRW